jgi:hypothetical protein
MSDLNAELTQVETEIAEIQGTLATKLAIRETLRRIAGSAAVQVTKQRPSGAIRALVAKHPDGILLTDIADQLQGVIETTSGNPRRIIQNTVNQLANGKHIKLFERHGKKYAKPASPA